MVTVDAGARVAAPRSGSWARRVAPALWFLGALAVYFSTGSVSQTGDAVPASLIPLTVILDGSVLLDGFAAEEHERFGRPYWLVDTPRGTASFYPIAAGIVALPLLAVPILYQQATHPLTRAQWRDVATGRYQKAAAATIVALSVVAFWSACEALGFALPLSLTLTGIFAFGSEAFSGSSQGLWQHGPASLALLVAIGRLAVLDRRSWPTAMLFGLALGLAVAVRPTCLVLAAPLLALAIWRVPRQAPLAVAAAAVMLAPFVAYNLWVFGSPLGGYGSVAPQIGAENLAAGLAGVLVSPSRGLLLYFPAALLALVLLAARPALWRDGLVLSLAAGIVLLVGVVAAWPMWWGGFCFGPRLLTEAQGSILLLLGLAFPSGRVAKPAASAMLGLVLLYSIGIQIVGAFSAATMNWNDPPSVDAERSRLWDFGDNPVLRGLRANLG
jgi:hypothetical protein